MKVKRARQVYLPAAYAVIPALAASAVYGILPVRLFAALVVTVFHLGECTRTTSHRDYLMVYNCWALAADAASGSAWIGPAIALGLVERFDIESFSDFAAK